MVMAVSCVARRDWCETLRRTWVHDFRRAGLASDPGPRFVSRLCGRNERAPPNLPTRYPSLSFRCHIRFSDAWCGCSPFSIHYRQRQGHSRFEKLRMECGWNICIVDGGEPIQNAFLTQKKGAVTELIRRYALSRMLECVRIGGPETGRMLGGGFRGSSGVPRC
jgi:hypothetical protein